MGTNFYKVKKMPREWKQKLKDAINNDRLEVMDDFGKCVFKDEDGDWLEPPKGEVHIGKRSAGWKFLFDHNNWKYFSESKDSLIEWLKNPDEGEIVDEYGTRYTFDDFWKDVMDTYTTPWIDGSERLDGESYYKKYPEERYYSNPDRYVDGLRFSKSTNFS